MSLDLELYKDRLNAYKIGGKEGKIDSIKKQILDDFMLNPSHEEVTISGETRDVHIVTEGAKGNKCLCKPNEDINVGEYIIWNNKHFLCTYRFSDDKVQTKATIQKCNHNLKWINQNDQLITRPCIEDARTLYTTGVKDEKVIEIPNGMVGIQLPNDEETRLLDRGDSFIFNKTKYEVTFYDQTTYPGLIVLICTEIGTSHLDDEINEIADRWVQVDGKKVDRLPWLDEQQPPTEPDTPTIPETGTTYTITAEMPYADIPDDEIWLDDPPAIYTVHKFVDGVETSGIFTFKVTDTSIVTITETTDNSASIIANNFTGKKNIKLIATDTDTGEIAIEKGITICGR